MDGINAYLTEPDYIGNYEIDCTKGYVSGATYTLTNMTTRYDDFSFLYGLDLAATTAADEYAYGGFFYLKYTNG